ncbi:MAG: Crp/Fnr family transcriptional regulator [Thermoanaerobaculia bacterium]|nr:Crp/Fnr family transcriptional regulator [Thermoanaerobaculia bacterium]
MPVEPEDLTRFSLFEGLDRENLAELASRMRRTTFPSGTRMLSAQQPGEAVYLLEEGAVKIQLDRADGSETTLALLGPGDTVGEMSLLDHHGRSANVVTHEDSVCLWMDRRAFLDSVDSMEGLSRNIVHQLSQRLRAANQQILALSTLDVAGRLARQLLTFVSQYGEETREGILIPFSLTQSDLAGMVGATRERVNRVVVQLKRDGVLSVDSRYRITVHEIEPLAELCR